MLEKELKTLGILIDKKKTTDEMSFQGLWEIYLNNSIKVEDRIENLYCAASVFWKICLKWNGSYEGIDINRMKEFINYIAINSKTFSEDYYESKEIVFIKFLYWLMTREQAYEHERERFYVFYKNLNDVLGNVKWIFEVKEQGLRIFPINRLLDDVVTKFQLNEECYLQLVFSLQLFNKVENISNEEQIKKTMLKIADDYHIELIKMLCDGGEILYDKNSGINCAKNGTIVALHNDTILIRNVDRNYFDGKYDFEGESLESAIAYYSTYTKQSYEVPCDFRTIMLSENYKNKQRVLCDIMEKRIYNVFLGDVFLVDEETRNYSRIINEYAHNDRYIISDGAIVTEDKSLFDTFWEKIAMDQKGLRLCTIAQSEHINVLTLDFLAVFSKYITEDEADVYSILTKLSRESFYQNQLWEKYFENALEKNSIFQALSKYRKFLNEYLDIESVTAETSFKEKAHLVYPYSIYIPFDGEIIKFMEKLIENGYLEEDVTIETLDTITKPGNITAYIIGEKEEIAKKKVLNLKGIEASNIQNGLVFYNKENATVYVLEDYREIESALKKISENFSKMVIKDNWIGIAVNDLKKMVTITDNIGFEKSVYEDVGSKRMDKYTENIALYKYLWLIQVYQFTTDKLKSFQHIILDQFYCEFALDPRAMMDKFVGEVGAYEEKKALIIGKEPDGEGSTLKLLVEHYASGDRGALKKAFEGGAIQSSLSEDGKYHYYMGEEIKEIVFLTDNALSGKSTEELLNYYLKNQKNETDKRRYVLGKNIVSEILKSNTGVKIVVKTVFYSERAVSRIEYNIPEYEIEFQGKKLVANQYTWTKEMNDTLEELFGECTTPVNGNVQCVLRPYNMPHDRVLPNALKDELALISIFRKKAD